MIDAIRVSDGLLVERHELQAHLSAQGLALVPASDVPTPEERAVLEAVATIPAQELRSSGNWYGWAKPIGEAERARRAAKTQ